MLVVEYLEACFSVTGVTMTMVIMVLVPVGEVVLVASLFSARWWRWLFWRLLVLQRLAACLSLFSLAVVLVLAAALYTKVCGFLVWWWL